MPASNQALLQELKTAGLWFRARKTRPIWIRRLNQTETVQTLEGAEQVPDGAYLCRGEAGDIWPQSRERITSKYVVTDERDDQGWRKCTPRPDAEGILAAQVAHPFHLQTPWGLLSGKPGDYAVKHYEDRHDDNPADVWIVDQKLFEATYDRVDGGSMQQRDAAPQRKRTRI